MDKLIDEYIKNNNITITQYINKFNYKEHRKNAYKLLTILLVTVFIMLIVSFRFYNLDLNITLIYFVLNGL